MSINYSTLQNTLFPAASDSVQTLRKCADGVLDCYGDAVPGDGLTGYAPGCIFHHVDGNDDEVLYVNQGSKVSCEFAKLDKVPNAYGTAGGTGPSPIIWHGVDVLDLMLNPQHGIYYFDDFLGPHDPTNAQGWVLTQSNSTGTLTILTTDQGGVLQISSVGALEDDSLNAQLTSCNVKPADGVKIYFEARVNMTDATQQFVIGLAEVNTAIMTTGALDTTAVKCVFYHAAGGTDNKISAASGDADSQELDADVAANVDNTYVKLGFVIDGLDRVDYYVNGVKVGDCAAADDIPNALMCLTLFAGFQGAAGVMHIDWVRVAQVKSTDGGRAT